jgi:hypothetical protein
MGIEVLLIAAGVAIVISVLASRRILQKRMLDNKDAILDVPFYSEIPSEIKKIPKKSPILKGDGSFAFKSLGCIPYEQNFEQVRISRRIYFVEPTLIEVLLIPDPSNVERKLAVAVTVDSKILGYLPTQEAGQLHKYLLAHSSGIRAKAKIYIGSRPEYNGVMVDLAKPLKLESKRNS